MPSPHVTCYVSAGGRGSAGAGTAAGGRPGARSPQRPAAAACRPLPSPRSPFVFFLLFLLIPQPGGKMWLKLCFLLLYFLLLFVLARVFEAVVWYETGFFATQLVDPVALSFRKLRTILECRGLGHSGLPEKKDVRELVEKSGRAPPASLLPSCLPLATLFPSFLPSSLLLSLLLPFILPSLLPPPASFPPSLQALSSHKTSTARCCSHSLRGSSQGHQGTAVPTTRGLKTYKNTSIYPFSTLFAT